MFGDWDPDDEDQWVRETWEANHLWNIYVGKFKRVIQLIVVAIIVFVVEAPIIVVAMAAFDFAIAYKI